MAADVIMGINVDGPSLRRVIAAFDRMPEAARRAMFRANRDLENHLRRVAVRAASRAVGFPQKYWMQALRFYVDPVMVKGLPIAISVWIGTNPVPVHRLGKVSWRRATKGGKLTEGAKVGKTKYPGSWSWGAGSKTGAAVMQRTSRSRLPIRRVEELPHEPVAAAIAAVADQGGRRYERILARELKYALTIEAAK